MAASATRFKTCLTLLAAGLAWTWFLAVTPDLQAETFSIPSIDSTANLYWAGLKALPSGTVAPNGKGSLPPSFTLPAGTLPGERLGAAGAVAAWPGVTVMAGCLNAGGVA